GPSSPATASPTSTAWSPTTAPATAPTTSPQSYAAPAISGSRPTRHATTAKSNVTTASWPKSSSTPTPGPAKNNAPQPWRSGTSTTTTIGRTMPPETSHQQPGSTPASPTSLS